MLVSTHYMDEAERCHALAYISYGRLLARGTGAELIAHAALASVEVDGPPAALALARAANCAAMPALRSVACVRPHPARQRQLATRRWMRHWRGPRR